ncbi:2150_t:CDS:2 [Entrophospora sp. SA101]|nr:8940_t:CDS:2 [Entrophospora sp. SA101]CAJ0633121.1 2150_t:CDS:2 [Entrophospora sp. SA101]CAJ0823610.1 16578_t:CDS:2 [Entrophospora sp. SA101]CAJ0830982.1 5263_t:CDS:2 [Entrophospora sp. SA101]CAJ0879432.1 8528_t:CDS:2 [Entrophospora sp. SA101]
MTAKLRPTIKRFNSLLNGYLKNNSIEDVEEIFKYMKHLDINPNITIYNTILNNLSLKNDIEDKALDLFISLVRQKKDINQIFNRTSAFKIFNIKQQNEIYNQKIETNQQKEVTIVKVKLKNNNKIVKLIPDAHIFTIFITEFAYRYENMPMAIKVYETMLKYNISPNVVTFTILIEGFGMSGELEKALEYFNIMTNKYNIKPNVKTYTSLIKALVKTKNLEKAEQVWYQMIKEGIKPERATYKVLKHINDDNYLFPRTPQKIKDAIYRLDLIKNIHNVDTVYELYKNFIKLNFKNKYNNTNDNSALAHKDIDSKTDVCSFTMFISIFSLRFGDMQKSLEIFQAMLKYKIKPNTITFTKLIEGFANLVLEKMKKQKKFMMKC